MDNQHPKNLISESVLPEIPVIEPKPKFPVMYLVLLLASLVLLASTAFLYYQNIQLKNMLINYQTQPTSSPTPVSTTDPTANWKTYTDAKYNFSFKYPQSLEITPVTSDSTSLKANPEYFVGVTGSDVIYLSLFLYKSDKNPTDWWNTDGKDKFEELRSSVESVITPKATINFTYNVQPKTFAGKNALSVSVNSDYGSPQTPPQRFLTIVQQNGYIFMTSYQEMGTTQPSTEISNQILSTFKFTN